MTGLNSSIILGIETSGFIGSVSLRDGDGRLFLRVLPRKRHAQSLLVEVQELFREANVSQRDCGVIAVSHGPGSFTGLRVGIVCAKTWAYVLGCRLLAVDTFLTVAENSPADVTELFVIGDAQRGDLFVGRYLRYGDEATSSSRKESPVNETIQNGAVCAGPNFWRIGDIEILDAKRWIAERTAGDIVSGPGVEKYRTELTEQFATWELGRVLEPEFCSPTAAHVVHVANHLLGTDTKKIGSTEKTDRTVWELEPFYLRRSAAEEKWDAAHH